MECSICKHTNQAYIKHSKFVESGGDKKAKNMDDFKWFQIKKTFTNILEYKSYPVDLFLVTTETTRSFLLSFRFPRYVENRMALVVH